MQVALWILGVLLLLLFFVIVFLISTASDESKRRKLADAARDAKEKVIQDQLNKYLDRDKPKRDRDEAKVRRRHLELELVSTKQKAAHLEEQINEFRVSETDPLTAPEPDQEPAAPAAAA